MRKIPFNEVITDVTSKFKKIKQSDYQKNGLFQIIDQGKVHIAGYTDNANLVNAKLSPVIIFGDHTRVFKYVETPIALGADGAKALWINPEIANSRYVFLYLKSVKLNDAGYSRHFKFLKELKIPIPYKDENPALDDQIRIATLLSRVEMLIATRKDNLHQLDEFLKSTFLEMFGDPVRNDGSWEKKPLQILGSINRGVSKHRPRNAPELLGGKYPLLQTGEVSNAGTYITEYKNTYSEIGFKQSKIWPAGTLCITIAANIAQTSILTFDACFPDSVVGFIANPKESHILYIHFLFGFFQRILEKNAPQAAQRNINLEILRNLEVPAPPIPLQEKFAVIVEKVESLKNHYQQNLTELENLYSALSQKAFKGELDLSRIPLNHKTLADLENDQDEVVATVEGVVPENISTTLTALNAFNQSATSFKAVERAARVSSLNPAQFESVKQAAAQLAAYHSPMEQLKNMSSITSAMEQFESTIKPLNLSQFDSISKSVELARNIASAIPKIDMGWLEQHNDVLKYVAAPFEAMHSTMAKIESLNYDRINSIAKKMESALGHTTAIPISNIGLSDQYSEALRKMTDPFGNMRNAVERASASSIYTQYLEATKWLQSPIPDFTSLQRLASNPWGMYLDNEAVYTKLQFHHEDVIDILDNAGEPLSFESLMQQLGELETVDFAEYETIKDILFDLLAGNLVTQVFDEKQKSLRFALVENGLEQ